MTDIPVAKQKSDLERIAGNAYSRKPPPIGATPLSVKSLEGQRIDLQEEISKLTMILTDESIPLNDDEIMDINTEVNELIQSKSQIEKEIRRVSNGQVDYVGSTVSSSKTVYFGRAKRVNESRTDNQKLGKRKSDGPVAIRETESLEEVVEKQILGNQEPVKQVHKKTRFDDDDDSD